MSEPEEPQGLETAPAPARERRRPGRVRRWVVRPVIWFLLFLVLVLAGAYVFLESRYAHRRAADLVVARASELLNRRIQVGRLDYNLALLSFELHDVVIPGPQPGDPAFARVPLVRVEFSWRDLRQRILRLEQIDIVRPQVYLRFEEDGSSNLPELRTRKGAKRRIEVQIGRIVMQEGVLEMDELRLPLELDARAVWATASGSGARGGEGGDRIDAQVTAQEVVTTLPRAKPYPFTASVKGSFVPGRITLTSIRAAGPDLNAQASGSYEWRGQPRRMALEIDARGWSQLLNRLGYLEQPIQGPFDVEARVARIGEDLTYTGTLRAPRIAVLDRLFADVEAGFAGGRDGVEIALERAVYAEGGIEGVISVEYERGEQRSEDGVPVELDLTLARLGLHTLITDQFGDDVAVAGELRGTVSGELVYRFRSGAPVAGSGLADLEVRAVEGATGLPLSGAVPLAIEEGVLTARSLQLAGPGQDIQVTNFVFDMDRGRGRFDFRLNSRDVGPLAPLLTGGTASGAPGEEPALWVPSQGAGVAEGSVEIAGGRISAGVRLDLTGVVSPVLAADHVTGSFRISPAAVDDLRLNAVIASGGATGALVVTGRVPLAPEGRARASQPIALMVDADVWPAAGIVAFLSPEVAELGVEGLVSGRLDLAGYPEDLSGRAGFTVADLEIGGVALGETRAEVAFQGSRVRVEGGVAETPAGTVLVAGAFDTETKILDFTVDAPRLSLAAEPFRSALGGDVAGDLTLGAMIGGTLEKPTATASVRGSGLTLAGRPLGEQGVAEAMAVWNGETLQGSGSLLGLASFEGGGLLTLERADLRFDIQSGNLGTLARLVSPQAVPEFTGSLDGSIAFASDFAAGTWRGEAILTDLRAEYEGRRIASREPVVVALTPGAVTIESIYLQEEETETELFASGTIGLGGEGEAMPLDLRFQSTLSAAWAELFAPDLDIEGYLDVLATVRGTTADPQLNGQGVVRDARLTLPQLPRAFDDIEGVVLFNRDAIILNNLEARFGDGRLLATGQIDLPDLTGDAGLAEELSYRVQVQADDVSFPYPEGFLLRGDADLGLVASGGGRQVRGQVRLDRAFYLEDVETETLQLLLNALQRQRLEVAETDEFLAGTQLNVQVVGPGALRVRNNVADLQGSIDLRIQGTLAAPVVFGEVEVQPGGTLIYADNDYEIERGLLTFSNPNRIDPVIDLVASTEIRSYEITLSLSGTVERLEAQFTSNEGLAELEMLALLTGQELAGEEGRRLLRPGEQAESDLAAQQFLAGQAASLVNQRVGNLFGFDRFRIGPEPTETGGALGGVRLTVGKRISRDVFVTYTTNPADSQNYIVRVEWQVARNLVLVLTGDGQDNALALDAQWERRY